MRILSFKLALRVCCNTTFAQPCKTESFGCLSCVVAGRFQVAYAALTWVVVSLRSARQGKCEGYTLQ